MPIPLLSHGLTEGLSAVPYGYTVLKTAAVLAVLALVKYYFGGARNSSERLMHSKVIMVTVCRPCNSGLVFGHLHARGKS